ncbi:GlxA family transcriptional regulator [Herbiconiux sp. CPCC 205763]|uniref:GlxA family transcriptional regulator n=1 Tax=Herbiconiux aconitum TaxID=2970913 RepID=A0ABT2GLK3_9MICO|nr:GlxA family transcriptional regulator [Herbiconiux aconitum]MCS5717102.1 GlxA family transcriptional regulator [Herbiconiux aconitum]
MPRRVVLLVFDGMKLLDVTGPAEVFSEANLMGADYELRFVSPDGQDVATSVGMRLPVDGAAADITAADTVMVSGGDALPTGVIPPALLDAARILSARTRRMSSICTGAFILAAGGLLEGRRATTHWRHAALLGRLYPSVQVDPDAIFVRDGTVYTSAGVSAGIDLALALVEEDHGAALTRRVAQSLVVYMQRAGGQSQFSASLAGPAPRTPVLRSLVDGIAADPAADHTLGALARQAAVSPRHLSRLFHDELGTTPAKYVEGIRFDAAKAILDAGHSVTDAAERSGFGSPETLRRAFVARLGVSPSRYQRRFRTTQA